MRGLTRGAPAAAGPAAAAGEDDEDAAAAVTSGRGREGWMSLAPVEL